MEKISTELSNKMANASFVCAVFVVFLHIFKHSDGGTLVWWIRQSFEAGMARMAVPFFFIASGFKVAERCVELEDVSGAIRKRLRSLVVPFFVWGVLYFIYTSIIVISLNLSNGEIWHAHFLQGVDRLCWIGLHPFKGPLLYPFWYVRTLFLIIVLFPVLKMLAHWVRWWGLSLLFICLWLFDCPGNPCFDMHWLWLGSFTFGVFLRCKSVMCLGKSSFFGCIALLFAAGLILYRAALLNGGANLPTPSAYHDIYMKGIAILSLVGVWMLMPSSRWPKWLTLQSFPIFCLHPFFLLAFGVFFDRLDSVAEYMIFVLLIVVGSIAFSLGVKKFFPNINKIIFGGRG